MLLVVLIMAITLTNVCVVESKQTETIGSFIVLIATSNAALN
jgi:hypothetical protein